MERKVAHQDVASFTKDSNGGQQHKTKDQGQSSSNGAPAAAKMSKPGTLNHHNSFRGKGHGEAGRKRGAHSKGIGITHKKSSIQILAKKKIQKREKKKIFLRDEVKEREAFVSEMRRQVGRARRLVVKGKATVQEFEAQLAQKRQENQMLMVINLWGQLLAVDTERYIFF